jgi:hypothetical protein
VSDFQLDDIAEQGAAQADSPWIRYTVALGTGPSGHALVNGPQTEGLGQDEIRQTILDRLNALAKAQTYPVVSAQLRTSGIRVHTNM